MSTALYCTQAITATLPQSVPWLKNVSLCVTGRSIYSNLKIMSSSVIAAWKCGMKRLYFLNMEDKIYKYTCVTLEWKDEPVWLVATGCCPVNNKLAVHVWCASCYLCFPPFTWLKSHERGGGNWGVFSFLLLCHRNTMCHWSQDKRQ